MNERVLEDAFKSKRENWTEHHLRLVHYIESMETRMTALESRLQLFQRAAADKWLNENLHPL